jgi:hypothetical protein
MCSNRKRRPRNSQDMHGMIPLISMTTTSVNGQIRKKSDLSCVGKIFHILFYLKRLKEHI